MTEKKTPFQFHIRPTLFFETAVDWFFPIYNYEKYSFDFNKNIIQENV